MFFDDARSHLVQTLVDALNPEGIALVIAPSRSGTFQEFAELCRPFFSVEIVQKYDDLVADVILKVMNFKYFMI